MNAEDTPLAIRCRNLAKRFGETVAVEAFNLDVWKGSLVGLLGPSGCGKTTVLRLIAGFEQPDSGSIEVGGEMVVGETFVPPEQRNVGMVFQDYALFPHMTVARNIGYGLADAAGDRVGEVIDVVGMNGLEDRFPHELSGGQQQRVALARALAPRPEVILLDEPFSNLDATLRDRVRREVREILVDSDTTAVIVTHDQEEALSMSDVVAVMNEGRVLQAGTPHQLYTEPIDRWVAGFVGEADFLEGVASDGVVKTEVGSFPADGDGQKEVMIRPEEVELTIDADGLGEIVAQEFYGHDQLLWVRLPSGRLLRARTAPTPLLKVGERVAVQITNDQPFVR